ncbi:hypothetical protein [Phreatobacter stygius]|uniref:Uncharacterized protein n=1 Tax=Phreatobacter stygius TaxID=1940610 RepID=A0A4D7B0E1_9HYPH|nr:hypothetical protein [Phreatobacter stygius]QCI67124.1 hypothetical protein E8M01_24535 [Phreatobacter stygius]
MKSDAFGLTPAPIRYRQGNGFDEIPGQRHRPFGNTLPLRHNGQFLDFTRKQAGIHSVKTLQHGGTLVRHVMKRRAQRVAMDRVDDAEIKGVADFHLGATMAHFLDRGLDRMLNVDRVLANTEGEIGRDDAPCERQVGDVGADDEVDLTLGVSKLQIVGGLVIVLAMPNSLRTQPG